MRVPPAATRAPSGLSIRSVEESSPVGAMIDLAARMRNVWRDNAIAEAERRRMLQGLAEQADRILDGLSSDRDRRRLREMIDRVASSSEPQAPAAAASAPAAEADAGLDAGGASGNEAALAAQIQAAAEPSPATPRPELTYSAEGEASPGERPLGRALNVYA